ncbi:NAD-dependent epimerase/dehydratase family protein [Oleiharenicola sp. Vm1]|uniref:NAD-dependent epimerase/dehydratase family protein n=1 Tax=Oleiharenicola sp. Vm1 TaxID=3398393 RepID=UPI0039F594FA
MSRLHDDGCGVTELAGDVREAAAFPSEAFAAIVHLAAAIPHRTPVPSAAFRNVNVEGTRRLREKYPEAHFVLASTADVRRTTLSDYARSKLEAEAVVAGAASACIVRLPSVFGPGQRQESKLIPVLLRQHVLGAPPPPFLSDDIREYLWIGDAVDALAAALRGRGLVEPRGVSIANHALARLVAAAAANAAPDDLSPEHRRLFVQLVQCADALRHGSPR